ncbi:MAG TPA: peptide chain release factor N(5)-glutamine methyltransferase [Ktedonobacterales bacterium]|nr:peptide chain release factor N(5)-glutamine methyltransferase [Ktedonobacterales bacterium]
MPDDISAARSSGVALWRAARLLHAADPEGTPELDAQVLLAHVLKATRVSVLAYPERALTPKQAADFDRLIERRAAHEPVAYLVGHREFMGLDFRADARALIPRPETELLVEAALVEIRARLAATPTAPPLVADIGTGSGAIALAVAALEPRLPTIYATDISAGALDLARENAARLRVADRVIFREGDLLAALPEPVEVALANLPYVAPRDAATLPADVQQYEPALALYGADDGLGHLRRFFAQAPTYLKPGAFLALEFGYDQRPALAALIHATFPGATARFAADYAGWDRHVTIHLP